MTLKFSHTTKLTTRNKAPHLVVFCDKEGNILGNLSKEIISRAKTLIDNANFKGDLGELISDYNAPILSVVGIGSLDKLAYNVNKDVAKATFTAIKNSKKAVILWGDMICHKHFGQFVLALEDNNYRFDNYKKEPSKNAIAEVILVNNKADEDYTPSLTLAENIIAGQTLAKDVANMPPNVCNPTYMAKQAKQLAKDYDNKVSVTILDEKRMQKLGMGCFLAVSQGSDEEGKIAVIEYFGKTKKSDKAKLQDPIALVGKGITFDTGGISLKPSSGMHEMKYDMGGAAAMLGVAKSLCESDLALDVVIVLALAENMPSGHACRPGDIVSAMDGTTVEILNTDAEGRLVLADALCYVQDAYKPKVIIDSATLTGACVVALGAHRSALYSTDEDTLFALESASTTSGDLVWHMPLGEDYNTQINSTNADIQNIGGNSGGGSITAACFLQRFIKNGTPWVHLDIAGTAWQSGNNKGASGRPVPLLMHYLKSQA